MNLSEIRELLRSAGTGNDGVPSALRGCYDLGDVRHLARRRVPRPVFDYVDGAADEEVTARSNHTAFQDWRFKPRHCVDVSRCDVSTNLLGRDVALPIALAPTGFTRMMHAEGELLVSAAARAADVPYALSTMSTVSIEDLARTGHTNHWFQLYPLKSESLTKELVERAEGAGFEALVVCVDTPVLGKRLRDVRNGLTVPPRVTSKAFLQIASRPAYWSRLIRTPGLEMANVGRPGERTAGTVEALVEQFDPSVTWERMRELRELWTKPLLIKGALGPDDAEKAADLGADGIWLSNHGGRQLDRTISPLHLLAPVRKAIGEDRTIVLDSGIRHGADVALALALGADSAAIGRGYLFGLMAAGEDGVAHVLHLLGEQLKRTMQLVGASSVADLRTQGPDLLHRPGDEGLC
jgi:L-lactate dehydrogenase (cytochrome)